MDVDYELKTLKDNLYDYFKRTYGTVNNSDDDNNFTLIRRKEPKNTLYI